MADFNVGDKVRMRKGLIIGEPTYTFQDFMEGKIKLKVQTQEEYNLVLRLIKNQRPDFRWSSKGALQSPSKEWNRYKSETTLNTNEGNFLSYGYERFYVEDGYTVVDFADLVDGDEEMKKYTIQDFINGEVVVNCETKRECYQLAAALEEESSNFRWRSGDRLANKMKQYWDEHESDIVFAIHYKENMVYGKKEDFVQETVKFSDLRFKKYQVSASGYTKKEIYDQVTDQLAEQDKPTLYWSDEENERAKKECLALMTEHIEKTDGREQVVFSGFFPEKDNGKITTEAAIILCGSMWPARKAEGFFFCRREIETKPRDRAKVLFSALIKIDKNNLLKL